MVIPVQFLCRAVRTVGLVLFYYVFSIGITFYNKWLMKVWLGIFTFVVKVHTRYICLTKNDCGTHDQDLRPQL